ncbi:3'-5' DNA helicase [Saccharomycopsis crataegensis]|uniref:ATP-dependent DNA helicase n=1 Tax=Saccharomycopsis crataegensis TaxID=43959 RepID=A0AAV5QKU4_9ASCO|nr:3'-5' DNA helicase [Saccharomycopsis crataegensis]
MSFHLLLASKGVSKSHNIAIGILSEVRLTDPKMSNDSDSDDFLSDSFGSDDEIVFLENQVNGQDQHQNPLQLQQYEEIPQQTIKIGPLTHHEIDYEALATYTYPVNFPIREYQFQIVKECFYQNLICAIPTGTGKTFISSCVMLNYYRWFPKSKIIFVAPTRPLVAQQIKAAVGMTGIKSDDVAILLDKSKKNRPEIWNSKRVFFSTPQVIDNDLKAGFCDPKSISLIVIDEAHRTRGNYAYNNIIKFISRFSLSFRILALTATPGSDIVGVQEVTTNLLASKIEIRTEKSPDIERYMKNKDMDKRIVDMNEEILDVIDLLAEAIKPTLDIANKQKVYEETNPSEINAFKAMEASQRVINNPRYNEGLKWYLYFILQLLNAVGQMLRRLKVYGIKTFYSYLENKSKEFMAKYDLGKSTNKTAASFYYHDSIKKILRDYKDKATDPGFVGHPKLEILVEELTEFFKDSKKFNNDNSRVIIFTEMRESALEIVKAVDSVGDPELLKPHIFIGQAKEKEKFDDVGFREKNKPKGRGRKKKADQDKVEKEKTEKQKAKESAKTKEKAERESRRTGSSESAQINGMSQKQQKQLIKEFKQGKYNILVATSIGEEGLDIGEVDLIVCYDATSSPIKNIQRMGRTGRKQDGKVLLLLTKQENSKFEKSMNSYEVVQEQITSGSHIDYCESDRIIPTKYKPICEKKIIEVDDEFANEEEDDEIIKRATQHMNGKASKPKKNKGKSMDQNIEHLMLRHKKAPKKKFFMPDGVETGFKNASLLVRRVGSSIPLSEENSVLVSDGENNNSNNNTSVNVSGMESLGENDIMRLLESSDEETDLIGKSIESSQRRELSPHLAIGKRKTTAIEPTAPKRAKPNDNNGVETVDITNDSDDFFFDDDDNDDDDNGQFTFDKEDISVISDKPLDISVAQDKPLNTHNDSSRGHSVDGKRADVQNFNRPSSAVNSISGKISPNNKSDELSSEDFSSECEPDTDNHSFAHSSLKSNPDFKSSFDGDLRIEKVVKKDIGKDITSMIKNTFGALQYKNNKIINNTLKRRRTLGVRRRPTQGEQTSKMITDEEMSAVLRKEQQERIRKENLERLQCLEQAMIRKQQHELKNKKPKNKEQDLKEIGDTIYSMKFHARSGYITQKQESDLYHRFADVANGMVMNELGDPLVSVRNGEGKTFSRIRHSTKSQRLIKVHELIDKSNYGDGYKKLRSLIISQKRFEIDRKKKGKLGLEWGKMDQFVVDD